MTMQNYLYKKRKAKLNLILHPFLYTNQKEVFHKKEVPVLGLVPVRANRHHLYPKDREEIPGINKEKFLLKLWEYKHFNGWNYLFKFSYMENGEKKCTELIIDEIITLMIIKHPFITDQVGSKAWKILFKNKTLDQALDLLCRMLAWKFNHKWKEVFPIKIDLAVKKAA